MKHIYLFLLVFSVLFTMRTTAQNQVGLIPISNPSFENWTTGNGYSVSVLFFPVSVYDNYTYPTGWNFPSYPVNESITYSGMTVNVNTNLPLLKVSDETAGVVDGSHALKMQSFMLSDIISSAVYSAASSSLDPVLTTTVYPTVLSTGEVDINQLLSMMYDITSNLGSMSQLLSALSTVDMNLLIDGGVPLNGAKPGRLTGYYKYTSAVGGDNGGVLMLGTKYNPTTHRREVVGGGYATNLTDTSVYTPFELVYSPHSVIDPTVPYVEADSLIILMFSSANTTPQQGSALYLDNLQLWEQDTCSAVLTLSVDSVDTTYAELSWTYEGTPDHFEVEYGLQGFVPGSGTLSSVNNSNLSLAGLHPDTHYDVYVRCVCDNAIVGDWSMISFHTDTLVTPVIVDTTGIHSYKADDLIVYPNPANGQCVVHFAKEMPKVIRLYTIEGVLLQQKTPNAETFVLNLPSSGVFILSCEMKEGTITRKILNR